MTFSKPSTVSSPVLPYAYGSLIPNTWFDYVDAALPSAMDGLNGGSYTPATAINLSGTAGSTVLTITGGAVNFNASSVLTINSSDTINMFGTVVLGANTVWKGAANVGIAIAANNGNFDIQFYNSLTAVTGSALILSAQNTFMAGSTGGMLFLNSGLGETANGPIKFAVSNVPLMTLTDTAGLVFTSGVNLSLTSAILSLTGGSLALSSAATISLSGGSLSLSSGATLSLGSSTVSGNPTFSGAPTFNGAITCNNLVEMNNGSQQQFFTGSQLQFSTGSTLQVLGGTTVQINAPVGAGAGSVFNFAEVTVPLTTLNGTTTLSSSQYNNPNITVTASGSLTGNCTLLFPSVDGTWFLDISSVFSNIAGNTFSVNAGGSSVALISGGTNAKNSVLQIYTIRVRGTAIQAG